MAMFLKCVPWCSFGEKGEMEYWMGTDILNINIKTMRPLYLSSGSALLIWRLLSSWCLVETSDPEAMVSICFICVHQRPRCGQTSIYFMTNYNKVSSQRIFPLSRAEFFALLIIRQLFTAFIFVSWEIRQRLRVPIFRRKNSGEDSIILPLDFFVMPSFHSRESSYCYDFEINAAS